MVIRRIGSNHLPVPISRELRERALRSIGVSMREVIAKCRELAAPGNRDWMDHQRIKCLPKAAELLGEAVGIEMARPLYEAALQQINEDLCGGNGLRVTFYQALANLGSPLLLSCAERYFSGEESPVVVPFRRREVASLPTSAPAEESAMEATVRAFASVPMDVTLDILDPSLAGLDELYFNAGIRRAYMKVLCDADSGLAPRAVQALLASEDPDDVVFACQQAVAWGKVHPAEYSRMLLATNDLLAEKTKGKHLSETAEEWRSTQLEIARALRLTGQQETVLILLRRFWREELARASEDEAGTYRQIEIQYQIAVEAFLSGEDLASCWYVDKIGTEQCEHPKYLGDYIPLRYLVPLGHDRAKELFKQIWKETWQNQLFRPHNWALGAECPASVRPSADVQAILHSLTDLLPLCYQRQKALSLLRPLFSVGMADPTQAGSSATFQLAALLYRLGDPTGEFWLFGHSGLQARLNGFDFQGTRSFEHRLMAAEALLGVAKSKP